MFEINSKKVIDFYENNKHLDFNTINEIFVDILQNLINNLSDNIDNHHNTELLNRLASRMEKMENNCLSQNNMMQKIQDNLENISKNIEKDLNSVLHSHKELLKNDIRETIKSNTGDYKNQIENILNKNNENFSQKMEILFQNKELKQVFVDELFKINQTIGTETSFEISFNALVESSSGQETLTISTPACSKFWICLIVPFISVVKVFVID